MENIVEQAELLKEKQRSEKNLQTLCESFIKGQGSIYVLEDGNKIQTDDGIQDNGPEYLEHKWNQRTIGKAAIDLFINSNGGSHRIFPKFQEYAITLAVSSSLLDGITLSTYKSCDFPNITFNTNDNNNSNIYIVNGHHRIAAWKSVHQQQISQLQSYENLLKGKYAVASDDETPEIRAARINLGKLKVKLFAEGGWGAVILDFGQFDSNIHKFVE